METVAPPNATQTSHSAVSGKGLRSCAQTRPVQCALRTRWRRGEQLCGLRCFLGLRPEPAAPRVASRGAPLLVRRERAGAAQASQQQAEQDPHQQQQEQPVSSSASPGSVSVILLSGGVGKRMGANMPKQYLPLRGQPIAVYSLLTFAAMPEVGEIVVVCNPAYREIFQSAIEQCCSVPNRQDLGSLLRFGLPGKERQDSVFNGLQEVRASAALVAVHDSARPLVTAQEMRRVLADAAKHGAAVLGVQSKATIKEADPHGFVARTLDRRLLWEMQTPQVMLPRLLRDGFEVVRRGNLEVTDDVSIVEHLGHPVKITEGFYTNIKVTTPDDMLVAEKLLAEVQGVGLTAVAAA